jgi:hypothetical protein
VELKLVSLLTIILMTLFSHCSLFEPRDTFEDPDDQNVVDMKWIAGILECPKSIDNGVRFDSYLLTEMFTADAFEYRDVNAPDGGEARIFAKQQVVDRLNTIGNPKSVEWLDVGNCTNRGTDTIFVRDAVYKITFTDTLKITGKSDFDIVKQDKYRISKWKNYPSGITTSYLTPIQE